MSRRRVVTSESEEEFAQEQATPSIPSDDSIETALRDAVADVFRRQALEELTMRRIRAAAGNALGLDEGFFKGDARWKEKSDQIIKDEVSLQEKYLQDTDNIAQEEQSPSLSEEAMSIKRTKREESPKPRKRRKTSEESVEEAPTSGDDVKRPVKKQPKQSKKPSEEEEKAQSESEERSVISEEQAAKPSTEADDSESEMSVVLDEPAKANAHKQKSTATPSSKAEKKAAGKRKDKALDTDKAAKPSTEATDSESEVLDEPSKTNPKKRKSSEAPSRKGKTKSARKGKDNNLDPDQTEIKRLQGWLVKCGVRKLWSRELAPYDTPKAKIKHLRGMLKDVGMEGRCSLEKARQIREERELKADLEQVQEGAKKWGTGSAGEESDGGKPPRRRLARGRRSLAFLENDEGEETE